MGKEEGRGGRWGEGGHFGDIFHKCNQKAGAGCGERSESFPWWSSICNRTLAGTWLVARAAVLESAGAGARSSCASRPKSCSPYPTLTTHIDLVHGTLEAINNSHRLSSAKGCRQFLFYNKCN